LIFLIIVFMLFTAAKQKTGCVVSHEHNRNVVVVTASSAARITIAPELRLCSCLLLGRRNRLLLFEVSGFLFCALLKSPL